ncbi:MAG: NAD(P)H-dependent oxidoreductase [Desulfatibacillaceae bacterium]
MRISVILGHPNPGSFNHAIADTVVEALKRDGHDVRFHDLYAESFDPVLPEHEIPRDGQVEPDVNRHCEELAAADGIIIVHPNWWGMPPAIMKGWIDRVLRPGKCYEFVEGDKGEGVPRGLLKAGTAVVFNTSNTFPDREREVFGDPLELLWKNCIFSLCGVPGFVRRTYSVIVTSTVEQRREWLDDAVATALEAFTG